MEDLNLTADEILARIYPDNVDTKDGKLVFTFVEGKVSAEEVEYMKKKFDENEQMKGRFEIKLVSYAGDYQKFRIDQSKNCPICHKRYKSCKGHS